MRKVVLLLAVIAVGIVVWTAQAQPSPVAQAARSIRILSATASNGVITLRVTITGWKMYPRLVGKAPKPDGGHWHVYVDGRFNNDATNATRGTTKLTRLLSPGTYRVSAHLANNNHVEPRPRIVSNVVTVRIQPETTTTE